MPSCGCPKFILAWSANKFRPLRHLTLTSSATGGVRVKCPRLRRSSSSVFYIKIKSIEINQCFLSGGVGETRTLVSAPIKPINTISVDFRVKFRVHFE